MPLKRMRKLSDYFLNQPETAPSVELRKEAGAKKLN